MQSSLAKQLQQLKVQEKDEIELPSRTKLSFLFDIKQAANIDDQTLYYICLNGLQEIQKEIPQLNQQLDLFKSDILHQKSLEFYRGQETKATLKEVDEKIELLIKHLAPYFLYTATHKVLEYLIRVYQVNSYHKQTLVLAFLPYYETSFFLRLIQTLQLKNDEYFYFLEEYAYKGEKIEKNILVRALSRNDAIVFTKYSEFCFNLAQLHQQYTQDYQNSLHWKFFGSILVEVLKFKQQDSQTLMFNILPFIAKSIKSQIKELKTSALLAISQICSRKSLSHDYTQAFIKEIIICIKDISIEDQMVDNSVVVLMIVLQFQRVDYLEEKEIQILLTSQRIKKSLLSLQKSHDTSNMLKVITNSFILSQQLDLSLLRQFFQNTLNLKATYKIIEQLISQVQANDQFVERASQILEILKEMDTQQFNQCQVYLIKSIQSQALKEQVIGVLQQVTKSEHLVAKFGEKEYSLLSALASHQKITRMNALKTINQQHFIKKISQREKDLIKLQLLNIISRSQEDQETMELMINSLALFLNEGEVYDSEFEILEQFFHENFLSQRYPIKILSKVQKICLTLNVSSAKNQSWLAIWQVMENKLDKMPNQYNYLQGSSNVEQLCIKMLQEINLSYGLILQMLSNHRAYHSETIISQIIKEIGQHSTRFNQDKKRSIIYSIQPTYQQSKELLKSLSQCYTSTDQYYTLLD